MNSIIVPLISLVTPLFAAESATSVQPAPAPVAQAVEQPKEAQVDTSRPLSTAEHNYIVETLARSVEAFHGKQSQLEPKEEEKILKSLELEVKRVDVSLDGLSESQRSYLLAERKIFADTLALISKADPVNHQSMLMEMFEKLNNQRKHVTPDMLRLFGDQVYADEIAAKVEIDKRLRAILNALHAPSEKPDEVRKKALEDMLQLATHIRSFKK